MHNKTILLGIGVLIIGSSIGLLSTVSNPSVNVAGFILCSLIVLTFSIVLMQAAVNLFNLKNLTIPGVFYLAYLAMIFFPSFFVAVDKPAPYRYVFLFAITSVLFTVPAGIWVANIIFKFKKIEITTFFATPIETGEPSYHRRVVFGLFLFGAFVLVFFYLVQVETVPLFAALRNPGTYHELTHLREESFKLLETPLIYPYYWLRAFLFPVLIMLPLGYYLQTRQRVWLFLFLITLGIGVLYCGFSLAKMPVAAVFLMIVIFMYLYRAGHINKKSLVCSLGLIFSFPLFVILIGQYTMGVGFWGAVWSILRRLFYVPAYILYHYFEIFPDQIDYLYGRSIGKLAWLMGEEHFNTANYVYRYLFPDRLESGQSNAAFIGNLNADFGLYGVFIGGLFAGFFMQGIQIWILRRKKTVLTLTVYAFMIYAFWLLNHTALPVVLLSNGVILALVFPLAVAGMEAFFKDTVESHKSTAPKLKGSL